MEDNEIQHAPEIEALIKIAFEKGVNAAIKAAREKNDPHMLDDFHDAMIDRFYKELVRIGKIPAGGGSASGGK